MNQPRFEGGGEVNP